MNLDKLDVMLCLSFQESDGPINIVIEYLDKTVLSNMTKEEIKNLSDNELVVSIKIADIVPKKRWIERYSEWAKRKGYAPFNL